MTKILQQKNNEIFQNSQEEEDIFNNIKTEKKNQELLKKKINFFLKQICKTLPQNIKDDNLSKSPLDNVPCQLCLKKGNRTTSGRLLNYEIDKWVHTNCALFSDDVKEQLDGGLYFEKLFKKVTGISQCYLCQQQGATISCVQGVSGCKNKMHFNCGISNDCPYLSCKSAMCHICKLKLIQLGEEISNENQNFYKNHNIENYKFVNNFCTNRKLYIMPIKDTLPYIEYNDKCFNRVGTNSFINIGNDQELRNIFQNIMFLKTLFCKHTNLNRIFSFSITLYKKKNKKQKNLNGFKIKCQKLTNDIFYQNQNELNKIKNKDIKNDDSKNKHKFSYLYKRCEMTEHVLFKNSVNYPIIYNFKKFYHIVFQTIHENEFYNQLPKELKPLDHEILCDMIGINNDIIRSWILCGDQVNENNGTYNTIKEYFYESRSFEHINYFEKQKILEKGNQNQIVEKKKKAKKNTGSDHSNLGKVSLRVQDLLLDGNWEKNLNLTQTKEKEFEKKMEQNYQNWSNQQQYKHLNVYVAPSQIHKYGLFTKKKFEKDEIVIEYVGEKIRNVVADSREIFYEQQGFGDCYLFRANRQFVIDATFRGNEARYLNHSCDPTCSSIILEINQDPKIIIYAKREIEIGEEITYDYHFEAETEKLKCTCGAENCQGILN